MTVTLDGRTLTVTRWGEDVATEACQWDQWSAGTAVCKRKVQVFLIVRTYMLNCVEQNVTWVNSLANYFETVAQNGSPVVLFSDDAERPVSSVSVYVLQVTWTFENLGGQNVRKFTLTLQEA